MARLAGLRLRDRWAGWKREPFTGNSIDQVVVYEKPGERFTAVTPPTGSAPSPA